MSLLFNMLSRLAIIFFFKCKHLLMSWLQSPSTVILEPKKIKSVTISTFYSSVYHEVMELDAMILVFLMLIFKPAFSLSSFTLIMMLLSSSSLYAITVVSYGGIMSYLRLMILLLAILIPTCISFSPAFYLMYSANKQGDNIQPWHTLFPILNQSIVSCLVLTVASWPAYRFLGGQIWWSGIVISLRSFHNLLWSTELKVLA